MHRQRANLPPPALDHAQRGSNPSPAHPVPRHAARMAFSRYVRAKEGGGGGGDWVGLSTFNCHTQTFASSPPKWHVKPPQPRPPLHKGAPSLPARCQSCGEMPPLPEAAGSGRRLVGLLCPTPALKRQNELFKENRRRAAEAHGSPAAGWLDRKSVSRTKSFCFG